MSLLAAFAASTIDRFVSWMSGAKRAAYSTSALRIIYAIALLSYFGTSFRDRHYLWGAGSTWVDPETSRRTWWPVFDILFPKDNRLVFDIGYVVFLVLIVLFLIGWRTKFITPLVGFYYLSLVTNSTVLSNGGDTLVRITFLFLILADLSQHWSVDARRRKIEEQAVGAKVPLVPTWISNPLHNAAVLLCGYQIMVVYVVSGLYKAQGTEWMEGTALYYAMTVEVFMVQPPLSQFVWQSTLVVGVGTFLSIWIQVLFPLLVLWRPTRIVALLFLLGMHFGIGVFLGLWPFSLPMMALDLLFVRDTTWESVIPWTSRVRAKFWRFGPRLLRT